MTKCDTGDKRADSRAPVTSPGYVEYVNVVLLQPGQANENCRAGFHVEDDDFARSARGNRTQRRDSKCPRVGQIAMPICITGALSAMFSVPW